MDARLWIRVLSALLKLHRTHKDKFITMDAIADAADAMVTIISDVVLDCVRGRLLILDTEVIDGKPTTGFRFASDAHKYFALLQQEA